MSGRGKSGAARMVTSVSSWEPRGRTRWAVLAAALLAGLVVHLGRRHGVLSHPILFAEDGSVFFRGARAGAAALDDPYAGYLVMGPRALALLVSVLPLAWTPAAYSVLAAAFAVASCGIALSPRVAWLLGGLPLRLCVFGALLLLPSVAETHATLTNVMWWGGIGLLLLGIADDPESALGRVAEVAFVVAVLLSGPIGVVFAPVIVWRWWRTRSLWTALLGGVWAATCLLQLLVLRGQHRDVGRVHWDAELGGVLVRRWFGPFAIGGDYVQRQIDRVAHQLPHAGWSRTTWLLTILFLVLVVVVALRGRDRGAGVVLLVLGALHVLAGFVAMGPLAHLLPDRYTVGASAALVLAMAGARPDRVALRLVHVVVIVWALVVWPTNLGVPPRLGPSFAPAARCLDAAPIAGGPAACHVPVYPEPFSFDLER